MVGACYLELRCFFFFFFFFMAALSNRRVVVQPNRRDLDGYV